MSVITHILDNVYTIITIALVCTFYLATWFLGAFFVGCLVFRRLFGRERGFEVIGMTIFLIIGLLSFVFEVDAEFTNSDDTTPQLLRHLKVLATVVIGTSLSTTLIGVSFWAVRFIFVHARDWVKREDVEQKGESASEEKSDKKGAISPV